LPEFITLGKGQYGHVQNGNSLRELKELGGWSGFEMVLRYAHLGGDHLKGAANRVSVTNGRKKAEVES
jgi:hypothetical protein